MGRTDRLTDTGMDEKPLSCDTMIKSVAKQQKKKLKLKKKLPQLRQSWPK